MGVIAALLAAILTLLNLLGITDISWWIVAGIFFLPIIVVLVFMVPIFGLAALASLVMPNKRR